MEDDNKISILRFKFSKEIKIKSYVSAIDSENIHKIKDLINNEMDNKRDIVFEIYKKNYLNQKRLKFVMEKCSSYLTISSAFVKTLIKYNGVEYLNIIFNNTYFVDNKFILTLLLYYKNKEPISFSNLKQSLSKYKIEHKGKYFNDSDYSFVVINGMVKKENQNSIINYFYDACSKENEYASKYLIEHGINVNEEDAYGETVLFYACLFGNENIVKQLIKRGVDVNKESELGETALFNACSSGNENLVKYLIKHGIDINKENIYKGETVLFNACSSGNENLVKYLIELEAGAGINKLNKAGETVLFNACSSGNENLVKYLIELGVDINKENIKGETALFNACSSGNENLVKYLIELGAGINKLNKDGETPLYYACLSGNKKLVKYLFDIIGDERLAVYLIYTTVKSNKWKKILNTIR